MDPDNEQRVGALCEAVFGSNQYDVRHDRSGMTISQYTRRGRMTLREMVAGLPDELDATFVLEETAAGSGTAIAVHQRYVDTTVGPSLAPLRHRSIAAVYEDEYVPAVFSPTPVVVAAAAAPAVKKTIFDVRFLIILLLCASMMMGVWLFVHKP